MGLTELGWNAAYEERFLAFEAETLKPARVMMAHREHYTVHDGTQEHPAHLAGRLRHNMRMGFRWWATGSPRRRRAVALSSRNPPQEFCAAGPRTR